MRRQRSVEREIELLETIVIKIREKIADLEIERDTHSWIPVSDKDETIEINRKILVARANVEMMLEDLTENNEEDRSTRH